VTYDTSKDPRIQVCQHASELLKKSLQMKLGVQLSVSRDFLERLSQSIDSSIMTLMYMYQEPRELASSDQMKELVNAGKSLEDGIGPVLESPDANPLVRARLRWVLRTLIELPVRMETPGKTLASGVDILALQIRSVVAKDPYWITRVTDGKADVTVVTNIPNLKAGNVLAASFLPPREVGGTVSEAMFLGSELRSDPAGTMFTEDQVDAKEATSILYQDLQKK